MIIGDGMRIRDIRIAARPMTAVAMRITIGITAGVPFTMTIIGETTGMTQIDIGIVTIIVMTIGNQRNRISPNLKRIRRIGTIEKNGRYLCVSNTLRPKKVSNASGKGLKNLSERYQLLCKQDIQIRKNDHQFTVSIPLIYE